jgi:AbrB family looped-hinge helix DNA binding protein
MSKATLTSKGQVTIPSDIRDQLGLKAGDRLEFVLNDKTGHVEMIPATVSIRSLKGILPKLKSPLSIREMNEVIAEEGSSRG